MRAESVSSRPVVLLVDDVPDVRTAFRLALEDDFQVVEAWNGRAALDCINKMKVDAVVTDLYMPGDLDGVGLIQEICKNPRAHPPIVAMSGSPNLAYRSSLQTARYVGADAIFTKPVPVEELVRTLRSLIGAGQD